MLSLSCRPPDLLHQAYQRSATGGVSRQVRKISRSYTRSSSVRLICHRVSRTLFIMRLDTTLNLHWILKESKRRFVLFLMKYTYVTDESSALENVQEGKDIVLDCRGLSGRWTNQNTSSTGPTNSTIMNTTSSRSYFHLWVPYY